MITMVSGMNHRAFELTGGAILLSGKFIAVCLLAIAILGSALAVVYVQAKNRSLFNEAQILQKKRDALYVEWGQLLLEQSTWATQARIQAIAEEQLQMQAPEQKDIVMVRN